ncbi:MAG TPA: hypothetical protein VH796_14280 [Nitrososphaeraceae archaeon]
MFINSDSLGVIHIMQSQAPASNESPNEAKSVLRIIEDNNRKHSRRSRYE